MPVDRDRVVIHLDVDCFYAQSEILRRPWLRDRPVGVTQKFLVVTSNYVARKLGVPKMVPIDEAKRHCSDLVLINGEDLTPYRAASKSIMEVIKRFGTVEKKGLDECAVDVTNEVLKRVDGSISPKDFVGHVLGDVESTQEDLLLKVGSQLAAEIRCAIERETGYQCSGGIAHNKMLAKMACSLHKPNQQTCITASAGSKFVESLPVRKIPGVGKQTETTLKEELGVETMADLRKLALTELTSKFGDRFAKQLFDACRGQDASPVQDKGYSKSLSVEDSFKPCSSFEQAKEILHNLAPDLIARLDQDRAETGRRPKTFTVKWKSRGIWTFTSTSAPMPAELILASVAMERRIEVLVKSGLKLLSQSLHGREFCVLNIGVTNFVDSSPQSESPSADIRSFMTSSIQRRDLEQRSEAARSKCGTEILPVLRSCENSDEQDETIVSVEDAAATTMDRCCCSQCGEELVDDRIKQQHMDFHLALKLQRLENGQPDLNTRRKRTKRNGTLDAFVLRRPKD